MTLQRGTSHEGRKGLETPQSPHARGRGASDQTPGRPRDLVSQLSLGPSQEGREANQASYSPSHVTVYASSLSLSHRHTHTHTQICKCTAVWKERRLSEPSALQVGRRSGWERCHQFVPSHGGHARDGEAIAAPCPHHG